MAGKAGDKVMDTFTKITLVIELMAFVAAMVLAVMELHKAAIYTFFGMLALLIIYVLVSIIYCRRN